MAAGFEPAEGCPSRAFEARSFGRSDTPPPRTVPNAGRAEEIRSHDKTPARPRQDPGLPVRIRGQGSAPEEGPQGLAALGFEDPAPDIYAMIEPRIAYHVEE